MDRDTIFILVPVDKQHEFLSFPYDVFIDGFSYDIQLLGLPHQQQHEFEYLSVHIFINGLPILVLFLGFPDVVQLLSFAVEF